MLLTTHKRLQRQLPIPCCSSRVATSLVACQDAYSNLRGIHTTYGDVRHVNASVRAAHACAQDAVRHQRCRLSLLY